MIEALAPDPAIFSYFYYKTNSYEINLSMSEVAIIHKFRLSSMAWTFYFLITCFIIKIIDLAWSGTINPTWHGLELLTVTVKTYSLFF
jgi:hypothetical protein